MAQHQLLTAAHPLTADIEALSIDPDRPLLVVDVDEVLALFVGAFERLVVGQGLEFRLERYALLQNIFRVGEAQHLEISEGQRLLGEFFRDHCEAIEPAPGAAEALEDLSRDVTVVVLTNAPEEARQARGRWLVRHGFDYPVLLNDGVKGPAVAALARRTAGVTGFVDDLLPNLDSAAAEAPAVRTFHTIADPRLRLLAPSSTLHPRVDDWTSLQGAIRAALLP
jgi:hypothetical protein